MKSVPSFKDSVYKAAARIPKGKVATYGDIAKYAGRPRAARAVGQLMAKNTTPETVPCHRVVGASGALTGYAFSGIGAKRKKLMEEGVSFRGEKVNLETSRWKP